MMTTRKATMHDVRQLVELLRRYQMASPLFDSLTFSESKARALITHQINSEDSTIVIAEIDYEAVGFLSYGITHWFCEEEISIEEMLYVEKPKAAILLVRYWLNNCLDRGVKKLYSSSTAGFKAEAYIKMMERFGFNVIKDGVFLHYG